MFYFLLVSASSITWVYGFWLAPYLRFPRFHFFSTASFRVWFSFFPSVLFLVVVLVWWVLIYISSSLSSILFFLLFSILSLIFPIKSFNLFFFLFFSFYVCYFFSCPVVFVISSFLSFLSFAFLFCSCCFYSSFIFSLPCVIWICSTWFGCCCVFDPIFKD